MKRFYYVLNDVSVVGRFETQDEAIAAATGIGEHAYILYKPEDALVLNEPTMRLIRAALVLIARQVAVIDMRESATALRDSDPVLCKREKSKAKAAEALLKALEEHAWEAAVTDYSNHGPRRLGSKDFIRSHFPEVSDKLVPFKDLTDGGRFSDGGVTTAICDLKNEKYCGKGGVITLEKVKAADGSISVKRTA